MVAQEVCGGYALIVSLGLAAAMACAVPALAFTVEGDEVTSLLSSVVPRIDPASLSKWHDLLGAEPHVAGTPGDMREIKRIAEAFRAMGLSVEVDRFYPYLAQPVSALVEIVAAPGDAPLPVTADAEQGARFGEESDGGKNPDRRRRGVLALDLREKNLAEDPTTAHPGLTFGWNAYSGSGDVTGEVVYANYGLPQDFARLREQGIDCQGKIVLIRYGGAFRAQKAASAETAGAAAVLLYTDPADSGINKGPVYPDGGWANATCIQRGTVNPLPYPGDPLTPHVPATKDAARLDAATVGLPTIPVQPLGYGAAREIIGRMRGVEVPDAAWQGGLPMAYRLTGGPDLKVRVKVEQWRGIVETANVIARLEGSGDTHALDTVIIGCHHDAWGFGAADPLAGTIVLMEVAKAMAEAAAAGHRPDHDILFCAWGAEEYGIIGSTEWVEARVPWLQEHAIAYINLDMAAMGTQLGSSASPSIADIVREAAASIPGVDPSMTALAEVEGDAPGSFRASPAGGGSDHVAFVCYAGIPSITLGTHGAPGTSYHSNYDTVAWYRQIVGDDYAGAALVSRMCAAIACRLADGMESGRVCWPEATLGLAVGRVRAIRVRCESDPRGLLGDPAQWDAAGQALGAASVAWLTVGDDPEVGSDSDDRARRAELSWLDQAGLLGRPWYRNIFTASDRNDGYGVILLPALAEAVEDRDADRIAASLGQLERIGLGALALAPTVNEAAQAPRR
ncbi:MAG: M28 family peptidase [Planctomycetota bacterium]|nr:M28 family peptidase [Planctomycetota bacterium]